MNELNFQTDNTKHNQIGGGVAGPGVVYTVGRGNKSASVESMLNAESGSTASFLDKT